MVQRERENSIYSVPRTSKTLSQGIHELGKLHFLKSLHDIIGGYRFSFTAGAKFIGTEQGRERENEKVRIFEML